MARSQGGERAERLTNTLFGAKAGGQHCRERALGLTSLRCTRRRCASATLSYDNMVPDQSLVPGFWTKYHVVVASSKFSCNVVTTQTRRRRCALLMMTSSMFSAKQRINEPPKMFGVPRVSVFTNPTDDSMVTALPTESQRYRATRSIQNTVVTFK